MSSAFFQQPPDTVSLWKYLRQLERIHPSLQLFRGGRSACGREIPVIGIGNLKKAVLFAGATHGQEWLTALLLARFAEDFTAAWETDGELGDFSFSRLKSAKGLLLLPMLNPDGVEIACKGPSAAGEFRTLVEEIFRSNPARWQANARGVDLNHNFDANWGLLRAMEIEAGITGPSPTRFGGPCPESEPETRAILQLIAAFRPRRLYSFHSQGEEIFWEYDGISVPQAENIARALSALSGYTLVSNSGLASHGGLKDWYIQALRRPGFTIEIGKGENPLPIEDLEPIYARLLPMLTAAVFL
jgi:g-D-glutamyl-meso-diaminopimelate peptidase